MVSFLIAISMRQNGITKLQKVNIVRNEKNNALYLDLRFWVALLSLLCLWGMSLKNLPG